MADHDRTDRIAADIVIAVMSNEKRVYDLSNDPDDAANQLAGMFKIIYQAVSNPQQPSE